MKLNVLVVDDSEVDRQIISRIIEKGLGNVNVIGLDSGSGIHAVLESHKVHVCILDLQMPEKDGLTILREWKESQDTFDIPVIVCTGIAEHSVLKEVLSLGAYDYFKKPLSQEDMQISLPLKVRNAIDLHTRTQSIVNLSKMDSLTGLYNRSSFKAELSRQRRIGEARGGVLMADINGLKIANDAYGSEVGDTFLLEVASILRKVAPSDAIVSRWGGDEFAVWLPHSSDKELEQISKNIKKAFSSYTLFGLQLSMSIGWDLQRNALQSPYKVLVNAEDAMFRDKIFESISIRSNMISVIIGTLHDKNPREEAHSRRVSELCHQMGIAMNASEKVKHDIKVVGLLHDIGKISIDESVLNKPGKLTHDEWLEIRRHPEIGYRILSSSPSMKEYAYAVLSHHERYDGKGYPNGLAAEQIPILARVLAIIDSFDAMTSLRTYKEAKTCEEAIRELLACKGTQFDPELTDLFVQVVRQNPKEEVEEL